MPLRDKSNEVIKYIADKTQRSIPIIGVGGIMSPKDALDKIKAGADLIGPSDMMDGRISAIRTALETEGFHDVILLLMLPNMQVVFMAHSEMQLVLPGHSREIKAPIKWIQPTEKKHSEQ